MFATYDLLLKYEKTLKIIFTDRLKIKPDKYKSAFIEQTQKKGSYKIYSLCRFLYLKSLVT